MTKTVTTKDNHTKDNQPKEKNLLRNRNCASVSFDVFWEVWPRKKGKQKAIAAFKKINPDNVLLQTMLVAVEAQKQSVEWIEEGGKYIPHPTTWLNDQRWEDEVAPIIGTFTEQQKAFIEVFNANIGDTCPPVSEWSQKASDLISLTAAGKWSDERWAGYWRYVRDNCEFCWQVTFEWLITRDNLVRVVGGEFEVAA